MLKGHKALCSHRRTLPFIYIVPIYGPLYRYRAPYMGVYRYIGTLIYIVLYRNHYIYGTIWGPLYIYRYICI